MNLNYGRTLDKFSLKDGLVKIVNKDKKILT